MSTPMLFYYINSILFQSRSFSIKIYGILQKCYFTCSCWLLSRSSLLYSGFRYTIELPLQPYQIQPYTFRLQWLAFFRPWFPDYITDSASTFRPLVPNDYAQSVPITDTIGSTNGGMYSSFIIVLRTRRYVFIPPLPTLARYISCCARSTLM